MLMIRTIGKFDFKTLHEKCHWPLTEKEHSQVALTFRIQVLETTEGQSQPTALRTTPKNALINLLMEQVEKVREILKTLPFLEFQHMTEIQSLDFNFPSFH